MIVRKARKKDLEILNKELGVGGIPWKHERNIRMQQKGPYLWLIAWENNKPIANLQIMFKGSFSKEVRGQLKNCPHLASLYVKESHRKKGIAKKMMDFAENLLKQKGFSQVGLAVEKGNKFLIGLYNKLGYKDWEKGIVIDSWNEIPNNKLKRINLKCNYLVKELK